MKKFIIFLITSVVLQQAIAQKASSCTLSNEVYNTCGTACPLTCDNYKNPQACTEQCVTGCYCEPGYVRNSDGNCVLQDECPQASQQVCKMNEIYNDCGSACPLTCDNYKNPPTVCTKQCVIGCACGKGYVRNRDGSCCLPAECEQKRNVERRASRKVL